MIRYVIHPGYVFSKNDGQRHYINGRQLIRLYGLNHAECVIASEQNGWCAPAGCIHLRPRSSGNYKISPYHNRAGKA